MKRHCVIAGLFALSCVFFAGPSSAQDWGAPWGAQIKLTYVEKSSRKLEQLTANCDWVEWDATITSSNPTCNPTVSQTATRADVLGQGLGYSFEHEGKLIFLFGDTFGATVGHGDGVAYFPTWTNVQNPFQYLAGDTIAWSPTRRPEDKLLLNYFLSSDQTHGLIVQPEYTTSHCYPDGTCGTALPMGADDIPSSGISLDGQIYIVASTGTLFTSSGPDYSKNYSVLSKFDEYAGTFSAGRTISNLPTGGHFVYTSLREFPLDAGGWQTGFEEPFVVIFGVGQYNASNIYLSIVPKSGFESGAGTRYFTGLDKFGFPTWGTNDDSSNVPIVTDVDPANPTIGNLSVVYSRDLGLWLMTFNGGHGDSTTAGVYFSYSRTPWGPWSKPQLILNDCRDGALGNYIFYYYDPARPATNTCPSAVVAPSNTSGPSGPTIGPQGSTGNPPGTTRGGGFAPQMIERFTEIEGHTLKIYYTLSTWNPYTVIKMESDFTITFSQPEDPD
ncbi:MAG TPA: DUF4185 domain-containing protein [Candidatus Acidoferrales bacterium]|jgi:hypothetical protein|nr:DUF4185 domain-containing protein [Candidatus Acidoferrales bacterium]